MRCLDIVEYFFIFTLKIMNILQHPLPELQWQYLITLPYQDILNSCQAARIDICSDGGKRLR